MSDSELGLLAEVVDRFITVQYYVSGGASVASELPVNQLLYEAARENADDEPLAAASADALFEAVAPGDSVLIPTGFIVPPWGRTEADGPSGAPGLSRALAIALEATPIVITEAANVAAVEQVMAASGLPVSEPERAVSEHRKATVLPAPLDEREEVEFATRLLEEFDPGAIIAIEKPSRNRFGVHHNGSGYDVSATTAGADVLINQAEDEGILTIGIGDGGNEIGMGCIRDAVAEILPTATECKCPCEGGIIAATETDHLVVGSTANWGAYGIEACLAGLAHDPHVMHDRELEERVQEAAKLAGLVDPQTGLSDGWLDGMPPKASANVVDLLNMMVHLQVDEPWQLEQRSKWVGREDVIKSSISSLGERLREEES